MGMTEIRIADKLKQFSTYEDGFRIYKIIKMAFDEDKTVVLSFDSITAVPSSFVNGCFSKLIDDFGVDAVKQSIRITQSTVLINNMIRRKFVLASNS